MSATISPHFSNIPTIDQTMVAKTAVAKKTTVSKSEYTGTKKIENASAPAKDPRRVAAAKKARATILIARQRKWEAALGVN